MRCRGPNGEVRGPTIRCEYCESKSFDTGDFVMVEDEKYLHKILRYCADNTKVEAQEFSTHHVASQPRRRRWFKLSKISAAKNPSIPKSLHPDDYVMVEG